MTELKKDLALLKDGIVIELPLKFIKGKIHKEIGSPQIQDKINAAFEEAVSSFDFNSAVKRWVYEIIFKDIQQLFMAAMEDPIRKAFENAIKRNYKVKVEKAIKKMKF